MLPKYFKLERLLEMSKILRSKYLKMLPNYFKLERLLEMSKIIRSKDASEIFQTRLHMVGCVDSYTVTYVQNLELKLKLGM
jgi:hypothetical protein